MWVLFLELVILTFLEQTLLVKVCSILSHLNGFDWQFVCVFASAFALEPARPGLVHLPPGSGVHLLWSVVPGWTDPSNSKSLLKKHLFLPWLACLIGQGISLCTSGSRV